ncbi:MAG: RHS repeat-associated core domain-containing protein [Myxococcales bacterium]|nr:RHS repeat-associated core domain-containing protein [Myxococcales bacterium]
MIASSASVVVRRPRARGDEREGCHAPAARRYVRGAGSRRSVPVHLRNRGSRAARSSPTLRRKSASRARTRVFVGELASGKSLGARYYAPWLGRWTTADPLGLQAGLNLYLYGRASPVVMVDPNGMKDTKSENLLTQWADVGKAVYQQVKLGAAYRSATEAKSAGGVEGGHVVFTGNADEDEATLGFVSDLWSGKYGTPGDYGTIAGGARRAAQERVGETIEAVTERPIETIANASMPIMWLVGLATTSGKATYTALEASDTADEAQRNEMYGEALIGAADTVSQIAGARTGEPGAAAKPGSFLQSRLGRTLTAPLWGFTGAGGPGGGGLKRGPKTSDLAPHNAKIIEIRNLLIEGGNQIIAGGRLEKLTEQLIKTPGGYKGGRRPDILYQTREGETRAVNVGLQDASGGPVRREREALEDLNLRARVPTIFIPYGKR